MPPAHTKQSANILSFDCHIFITIYLLSFWRFSISLNETDISTESDFHFKHPIHGHRYNVIIYLTFFISYYFRIISYYISYLLLFFIYFSLDIDTPMDIFKTFSFHFYVFIGEDFKMYWLQYLRVK